MSNVFEIKSFTGLSDYEDRGINGAFKFGYNLDIRKRVDSLSAGQDLVDEGLHSSRSPSASVSPSVSVSRSPSPSPSVSASPSTGESPSPSTTSSVSVSLSPSATPSSSVSPSPSPSSGANVSTIFQDLIKWFVACTDGFIYGFGNTGYIYRRDSDGTWVTVYKDADGEIKGASEWYSQTGASYLYWATNSKLNRKRIPGLSNWNDVNIGGVGTWPKVNLETTDSHMMREAGGSLIIANRGYLALVGYDDSYTNEALDLIPGNIAKTIVERNGRTIVGTVPVSDPDKGINAAIDCEVPLAQIGDNGELFYANMSDSIPVKRFPGGGKVNPGGVANVVQQANFFEWEQTAISWIDKQSVGNLSQWGVYDADVGYGGIYSYGRKNKNQPFVLNLDYLLDVDEIGAVITIAGTTLISYQDGSEFGVKASDANNKAEAVYEGLDLKAPVKKPVNITTWMTAELFMKPLPENTWVEFWYKRNKTGGWLRAKTADGDTQFNTTNEKKAVFSIGCEAEIFEPRVLLHPYGNTTPEVYRIRINFN